MEILLVFGAQTLRLQHVCLFIGVLVIGLNSLNYDAFSNCMQKIKSSIVFVVLYYFKHHVGLSLSIYISAVE